MIFPATPESHRTERTAADPAEVPLTRRAARANQATGRKLAGRPARRRAGFQERADQPMTREARRIAMGAEKKPAAKRKGVLAQLATAGTMLAVAAIALVTSVPANALLSSTDIETANLGVVQPRESQTLKSIGASVATEAIARDKYSVSDPAENALAAKWGQAGTFTSNGSGVVQWPFAVSVPISSGFGYRPEQPAGAKPFHSGLDFNPGAGAPIQAIADGVVSSVVESDSGLGVHVTIEHAIDGEIMSSVYAHMQFGSVAVSEGQAVSVGDRIGLVGSTGQATGPHLHFELHVGSEAIDPYVWLKAHAG